MGDTPLRLVERAIATAEHWSPGNWLSQAQRRRAIDESLSVQEQVEGRMAAARTIDRYILCWLAVEVTALLFSKWAGVRIVGAALAAFRLFEICTIWTYAVTLEEAHFGRRHGSRRRYRVVAVSRSMIHAILMLAEVVLCFALLASAFRGTIDELSSTWDALDYSLRSLTTVGVFGAAHGVARFVVDLEPLVALLFAGTVLSRLIGLRQEQGA